MDSLLSHLKGPAGLILVSAIIATIGAFLASVQQAPLLSHLKGPAGLILVSAIIAMIGAFWASVQQAADQKRFEGELAKKNEELRHKTDELAAMSARLANLVTGGNSFTFLQMGFGAKKTDAKIFYWTQGSYPMYDVVVRIVDLDKFDARDPDHTINLSVGNLNPGDTEGPPFKLPDRDSHRYNIIIQARNGMITEQLYLVWAETHWTKAIRVSDLRGNMLIMSIADDFPSERLLEENWDIDHHVQGSQETLGPSDQ
ncbi:MAG: hypothetical protein GY835_08820 [bacterium]|nr:hypothetical protein [bacterium]